MTTARNTRPRPSAAVATISPLALGRELQARLAEAGVVVEEARISHLAYAPEIAGAMLRRQQAEAVIAARQKIVQGAVSMVEMALEQLSTTEGRPPRRGSEATPWSATFSSSSAAKPRSQPVVNTGALHH